MARTSRGRHSEPPPSNYYDKDVKTVWTIILRKMAGRVHITAADGLLFTNLVTVHQIRFSSAHHGLSNMLFEDFLTRPFEELYHLVAIPTPKATDAREGVIVPMSAEGLEHYRPQWIQVCLMALAVGWVTAIDIINPIFPPPGQTWAEMVEGLQPEPSPSDDPEPSAEPRSRPKVTIVNGYKRDPAIAATAKQRANGVCQLCGKPAPFTTKKNQPYLESHHIVPLSEGGEDTIKNTAALCPNCHRRIHILKDPDDTKDLL